LVRVIFIRGVDSLLSSPARFYLYEYLLTVLRHTVDYRLHTVNSAMYFIYTTVQFFDEIETVVR